MSTIVVNSVQPIPKDSIRSTWRRQDRSQWTIFHWMFELGDLHSVELDRKVPTFAKDEKMGYIPDWYLHRFILFYTGMALVIHQLLTYGLGMNFHPVVAIVYYHAASQIYLSRLLLVTREIGHTYGFLDGDKHERDGVPDVAVKKAFLSILLVAIGRPLMTVLLTYRVDKPPSSISWQFLPLETILYVIVLDFWFYWYHRLMHEVDALWKYHRTHHLTKHPNPLLAIYADHVQEFFDIWGIPLMTYFTLRFMGLPMGYYEWYICQQYVVFAEATGHSGVRIYASTPSLVSWVMRIFDVDETIEDHDLHHRRGWKHSFNYGKQTRIWDKVFGTCAPRIESAKGNVDFSHTVPLPLFPKKTRKG